MNADRRSLEFSSAIVVVLLSAAGVAAQVGNDQYFLGQFTWIWGPQAALVALLLLFKPRPAAIVGSLLVTSVYQVAYVAFVNTHSDGEGLIWLGYLFSFPGAAIGAVLCTIWFHVRHPNSSGLRIGGVTAASTLLGLTLNQTVICSTVMYCGL